LLPTPSMIDPPGIAAYSPVGLSHNDSMNSTLEYHFLTTYLLNSILGESFTGSHKLELAYIIRLSYIEKFLK
jgi:hypothetical protein